MDLQEEFDQAIWESLADKDEEHLNRNEERKNKYYADEYAEPIKEYFKNHAVESFEVNYSKRWKCTPVCAFASSARLCYLYFMDDDEITFEAPLDNDLPASTIPTKMDAKKGNKNYECKCQEIVGASHTPFSPRYLDSPLFQSFFQNFNDQKGSISKVTKRISDKKTGKTRTVEYLEFDVKELNIKFGKAKDYAHRHFDLKQLICHLIALANNKRADEEVVLQYIFFTPNSECIEKYPKIKNLYDKVLEGELDAILAEGTSISQFAKYHKIKICYKRVELKDVPDNNYAFLWGKK